jgi:hypothetical protein
VEKMLDNGAQQLCGRSDARHTSGNVSARGAALTL